MNDQHSPATATEKPQLNQLGAVEPNRRLRLARIVIAALTLVTLSACTTKPEKNLPPPPVDLVIIKKSERTLELIGAGQRLHAYRISLGGSPIGHKYREGDQRTPEGRYVLNWRNPKSNYYKAIHISYPSQRDRQVSYQLGYKPGGMIMIHGLPNYIQSDSMRRRYQTQDWTHGCIAVNNEAMDEIWRLVKDGTPIQIMP